MKQLPISNFQSPTSNSQIRGSMFEVASWEIGGWKLGVGGSSRVAQGLETVLNLREIPPLNARLVPPSSMLVRLRPTLTNVAAIVPKG
jgi:hypothetical protein